MLTSRATTSFTIVTEKAFVPFDFGFEAEAGQSMASTLLLRTVVEGSLLTFLSLVSCLALRESALVKKVVSENLRFRFTVFESVV